MEFFGAWYLRRRTTSTTSSPGSSPFPKWRRQECAQPKFAPTLTRRGLTHYRKKPLSSIHCDYPQSWTNRWKICTPSPAPPNQGFGNGAFRLLGRFILDWGRGGGGGLLFHLILSKTAAKTTFLIASACILEVHVCIVSYLIG